MSVPCVNCGETEFKIILKDDTLHRYLCPKCKKSTYIYITARQEVIMFSEEELCPSCNGTGKCSKCLGTGKITCPKCDGKGYYESFGAYCGCVDCGGGGCSYSSEKLTKGGVVKGSGLVRCDSCIGTGVCNTCKGTRYILSRKKVSDE